MEMQCHNKNDHRIILQIISAWLGSSFEFINIPFSPLCFHDNYKITALLFRIGRLLGVLFLGFSKSNYVVAIFPGLKTGLNELKISRVP